jgi:hypothetical protein
VRGILVAAIVIAVCLTASPTQAKLLPYERRIGDACRFRLVDGELGWSTREVELTIACAVRRWPVPGGLTKARAIAWRESRFTATAYNASGCAGVYQWATGTWASVVPRHPYLAAVLSHNRFNARSNVLYAIKTASGPMGWSPWGG